MTDRVGLFHIVAAEDWAAALRVGEYRPASLTAEGFVHCSYAGQVAATVERYYAGAPDLLVVEFDPARITAAVREEPSPVTGELFPHVYGPIPTDAAVATREWISDQGDPAGAASPDR